MRILRVAQKVYPDVTGGGPYHVHALSRDQAKMGHDVTVLTVNHGGTTERRSIQDGYDIIRFNPTAEIIGNEISVGIGQFLATATNYDVIHAHSHLYFSTNLAALRYRLSNTPLAITNHGLYSQNAPRWLFNLYLKTAGRFTFNSADLVFCYTPEDRRRVQDLGVTSDIAVVENGIDTTRFKPEGPTAEYFSDEDTVILFIGRLVSGKRPTDALDAFARIADDYPDAILSFVGDGPLRDDLEERVDDHGLNNRVHFLGHVDYDDMPNIYREGDLLILTSESEGFPRTILEAYATGIPTVTSALPHVENIAEEGGETAPVGEVDIFSEKISQLLNDPGRRKRLGKHARDLVIDRFTWVGTVRETTNHLQKLVE